MEDVFKKDFKRYNIKKRKFCRNLEIKWIKYFRKTQNCNNLFKYFYYIKYLYLSHKTGIQIPIKTRIGEGFYIGHVGNIVINPNVIIGKNVNIASGVTIGQENRGKRKGTPTIGNEVWIGTNAVIVGNIKIGNDVLIAPLTFVNFDVPDHSIVIGNPGRIIFKNNATEHYINNKV